MTNRLRVGGIALVTLAVALAMLVAPAMAVAPTVDTETTDTSTTSDWTDGTVVSGFEANASNSSYIEANFETDNASIQIIDPDTGEIHAENTSSSMEETNTSNNYYAWNLSHDELATIPHDAGANKSISVKFINDTEAANPDTTTITVYLETVDDRAVVYGGDSAAAGDLAGVDVSTETEEKWFGFGDNTSTSTLEAESVGLGSNATGTDVHVIMANTSGEDPFSEASEGGTFTSIESKDFMKNHQLTLAGHHHAVFYEDAPVASLADGYTYAETTTINGHDAYTVHVDDDYDGESTLDVTATANGDYGFGDTLGVKADAYGGYIDAFTAGSPLTIGAGAGTGLVA